MERFTKVIVSTIQFVNESGFECLKLE